MTLVRRVGSLRLICRPAGAHDIFCRPTQHGGPYGARLCWAIFAASAKADALHYHEVFEWWSSASRSKMFVSTTHELMAI